MSNGIYKYLARPKSWQYLLDKTGGVGSTVSRAIKSDDRIVRTNLAIYSRKGWFPALEGNWRMRDVMMHLVIQFNQIQLQVPINDDKDIEQNRTLARHLTKAAQQLQNFADELNRRADALTLEHAEDTLETD